MCACSDMQLFHVRSSYLALVAHHGEGCSCTHAGPLVFPTLRDEQLRPPPTISGGCSARSAALSNPATRMESLASTSSFSATLSPSPRRPQPSALRGPSPMAAGAMPIAMHVLCAVVLCIGASRPRTKSMCDLSTKGCGCAPHWGTQRKFLAVWYRAEGLWRDVGIRIRTRYRGSGQQFKLAQPKSIGIAGIKIEQSQRSSDCHQWARGSNLRCPKWPATPARPSAEPRGQTPSPRTTDVVAKIGRAHV